MKFWMVGILVMFLLSLTLPVMSADTRPPVKVIYPATNPPTITLFQKLQSHIQLETSYTALDEEPEPGDIVGTIKKGFAEIPDIITQPNTIKKTRLIDATAYTMRTKPHVLVTVDGDDVAILPEKSKFVGMQVHQNCLRWGYGTDSWYQCEVNNG